MHNILASIFTSADFWDSTVRVTGPIAFAAIACTVCSRAGVLLIGIEGIMLISAFFSIAGTVWSGSIWIGVFFAIVAGITSSLLCGFLSMTLQMGDVVAGLVLHVGAIGLTAFLVEQWFPNGATIGGSSLHALWPSFSGELRNVLFHQQPLVYLAIVAAIVTAAFLRTKRGLVVRSSGESTRVAMSFGVKLMRLRFTILAVAGLLAGFGGATIGLALVGTFDTNVVSGQGFVGLACVMLGAWKPLGVLAATALFGGAYALQFRVKIGGQEWAQLIPYLVALAAIALFSGRAQGPAEEGRGLPEEAR